MSSLLSLFLNSLNGLPMCVAVEQRPWKSSREEIDEGNMVIEEFLLDFARVDGLADMSDVRAGEVLQGVMEKYKERIEGSRFVEEVVREM